MRAPEGTRSATLSGTGDTFASITSEGARQAPDVPGVEIAVHQGVRETAGRQVGEPCGQPVDEGVDPLSFRRVELVAMTIVVAQTVNATAFGTTRNQLSIASP